MLYTWRIISVPRNIGTLVISDRPYLIWDAPPPSNKHHQGFYIFSKEILNNLHLSILTGSVLKKFSVPCRICGDVKQTSRRLCKHITSDRRENGENNMKTNVNFHTLGCPPSQDASHHQDDITFLGSGMPTQTFICH